jgi:hypothetical protein
MDQMDDAILEREIVSGGILCEKSWFYAKKSYFFPQF